VIRDQNEAVTDGRGFAILIESLTPTEAVGFATFMEGYTAPFPVRLFEIRDLKNAARALGRLDGERFSALLAMRGAIEARDGLALEKAVERLKQVRESDQEYQGMAHAKKEQRRVFERMSRPILERFPDKFPELQLLPESAQSPPHQMLASEVSRNICLRAQIVLWAVDYAFRPAIYCDDMRTALYVHTFFIAPTGGLGFRSCPHDGQQFFQKRANQEYCCPAHREAHRVARWRANRKQNSQTETKAAHGRKAHGTKKTR